jgi:chorismate mutase
MAQKNPLRALNRLRSRIDRIDKGIIRLLLKRSRAVERIGRLKKQQGIPVVDSEREREILSRIDTKIDLQKAAGAQREFVRKVYERIFTASREMERGEHSAD